MILHKINKENKKKENAKKMVEKEDFYYFVFLKSRKLYEKKTTLISSQIIQFLYNKTETKKKLQIKRKMFVSRECIKCRSKRKFCFIATKLF